jgi:hypothetical protein
MGEALGLLQSPFAVAQSVLGVHVVGDVTANRQHVPHAVKANESCCCLQPAPIPLAVADAPAEPAGIAGDGPLPPCVARGGVVGMGELKRGLRHPAVQALDRPAPVHAVAVESVEADEVEDVLRQKPEQFAVVALRYLNARPLGIVRRRIGGRHWVLPHVTLHAPDLVLA